MKLIIAIISSADAKEVQKSLVENSFIVTKLSSTGGFLRKGNATFLIGVEDKKLQEAMNVISEHCRTRTAVIPNAITSDYGFISSSAVEVTVGGATLFVLDVLEHKKM